MGNKGRSREATRAMHEEIWADHIKGLSLSKRADKYGMSKQAVSAAIIKMRAQKAEAEIMDIITGSSETAAPEDVQTVTPTPDDATADVAIAQPEAADANDIRLTAITLKSPSTGIELHATADVGGEAEVLDFYDGLTPGVSAVKCLTAWRELTTMAEMAIDMFGATVKAAHE